MENRLKIKVCGMKYPENLEEVCRLEPDLIGYIFYRASRRFVGDHPDPALFRIPENTATRVGVFVNEPLNLLRKWADTGCLDMVQLHGDESPEYCKSLVNEGIHVIKALGSQVLENSDPLKAYYGVVHYILLDTPGEGYGGTGKKFDWQRLEDYDLPVPFFLSGGIQPGDAEAILSLDQMWMRGVDLNSGFEAGPGLKDLSLLEPFIRQLRKT
jgi:phosphoribosylanthranilate isomerase